MACRLYSAKPLSETMLTYCPRKSTFCKLNIDIGIYTIRILAVLHSLCVLNPPLQIQVQICSFFQQNLVQNIYIYKTYFQREGKLRSMAYWAARLKAYRAAHLGAYQDAHMKGLIDFQYIRPYNDVIKWKHFPRYWPFVWGIHRYPWIPHTKSSDAELWCFLWSAPE